MIFFNGEINMLEKYASPLVTFAILFSITGYVILMNYFVPVSEWYVK